MDISETYTELLYSQGRGYALWNGTPAGDVCIGDVGFVSRGSFIRLFNVHFSPDDPRQRVDLLVDHAPLPGSPTTQEVTLAPYTADVRSENGHVQLEISGPSRTEDLVNESVYRAYMRSHATLLKTIARQYELELEDLVLVTGRDLTCLWQAVVSNKNFTGAVLPSPSEDEHCLFIRHLRVRKRASIGRAWFEERWDIFLDWVDEFLGGEPVPVPPKYRSPVVRALDSILTSSLVDVAVVSDRDLTTLFETGCFKYQSTAYHNSCSLDTKSEKLPLTGPGVQAVYQFYGSQAGGVDNLVSSNPVS